MVSVLTRTKKCAKISFVFEKDAGVAQSVEQLIRNQQVRCSSHPTSSKKHRKLRFSVLFCCKNAENGASQNVGQLPDPHRDPHNELCGKSQRAPERKPFPFRCSACLWVLSNPCHETAHFLRSLLLHLPSGVGVGAECESGIIVAEHTADGFDVHAILQCQRCEGMSEIMKADMLQSRVLEDFLMKVYHRVWVVHFSCSAGREHPRIVRVLGVFLLQQLHGILRDGHLADRVAGFGAA